MTMGLCHTYLLLMTCLPLVLGAGSYAQVWPLGSTSCGFDVQRGNDAIQPKQSSCHLSFGSQHPGLPYQSFNLDGSMSFDLPVKVPTSGDFGFAINIKPSVLSGTFLDYRGNGGEDKLSQLTASLKTTGQVDITWNADEGTPTKTMPGLQVVAEEWIFMGFGIDVSKCQVNLQVNSNSFNGKVSQTFPCDEGSSLPLGTLRIGAKQGGGGGFRGDVTCAGLETGAKDLVFTAAIAVCQGNWAFSPNVYIPQNEPSRVFPLYDLNAGHDVVKNESLGLQNNDKDLRQGVTSVPNLDDKSLYFDGSPLSTVDVNFDFRVLQADFALAFYVEMDPSTFGTLAHAVMSSSSSPAIQEAVVEVNQTHLTAMLYDVGSSPCSRVSMSRSADFNWTLVTVERGSGKLFLSYDGTRVNASDPCKTNNATGTSMQGTLRLGGSLGFQEGYHGHVACLAVFNSTVFSLSKAKVMVEDGCNRIESMPAVLDRSLPTQVNYSFVPLKKDSEPDGLLMMDSEDTMGSEFKVRSLVDCAKECRLHHHCRSFTVSKVQDFSRERRCRLLDFLTRDRLLTKIGTNYYAMVDGNGW